MQVQLTDKVLLVTGSTQGVGAKIATLAANSGAAGIMLAGRNAQRGQEMASKLNSKTCPAEFFQGDLADPDVPKSLADATVSRFGRVDLLVNAAGITDRASLLDGDIERWDRLFAVNARAPFFLMQAVVADMRRRSALGAIVNILSTNAHCGTPDLAIYSATKGALSTLTRNVANAHMADKIRVNGINMGWAATPAENALQSEGLGKGANWEALVAADLPLRRLLTDDEVSQLAIFLLSDQAGLMSGALIDLEQSVLGAPTVGKKS